MKLLGCSTSQDKIQILLSNLLLQLKKFSPGTRDIKWKIWRMGHPAFFFVQGSLRPSATGPYWNPPNNLKSKLSDSLWHVFNVYVYVLIQNWMTHFVMGQLQVEVSTTHQKDRVDPTTTSRNQISSWNTLTGRTKDCNIYFCQREKLLLTSSRYQPDCSYDLGHSFSKPVC